MLATDLIELVLTGSDPLQLVEDYMLVQKDRDKNKPVNTSLSKDAKDRYRKNRTKYQRGNDKWVNSAAGKAFYRKLGRYNSRKAAIGV